MSQFGKSRRTWNDDQLRKAVATQSSWRQVARALGLKGHDANRLRRRADQLGLSTSHFNRRRVWDGERFRAVLEESESWSDVVVGLGLRADDVDGWLRVKGEAVRRGLLTDHLDEQSRDFPSLSVGLPGRQGTLLSKASVSIAAAWLDVRGVPVSFPTEALPYDLLAEFPDGIRRVQVKSTTCRVGNTWQVGVGRRPYSMDKSAAKRCYDPDDIDCFFVVAGDGDLFLIPASVLGGRTRVHLSAYREYRVGSAASLLGLRPEDSPDDSDRVPDREHPPESVG